MLGFTEHQKEKKKVKITEHAFAAQTGLAQLAAAAAVLVTGQGWPQCPMHICDGAKGS